MRATTATKEDARARAHKLLQLLAREKSRSGPADGCCRLLITAADGAHRGGQARTLVCGAAMRRREVMVLRARASTGRLQDPDCG